MPTSYSTLLGLALPVTGELSGTWGDEVNNYITQYLDSAVAGVQTISGSQTAVTLSRTTNAALSQAGSGATGSSQYQIINCTGNPASALTITVPSTSKVYVVLNNTSTSQTVTVKPSAAAGVTVAAARCALIAWNGTDFELVATDDASKMNGVLAAANGGTGQSSYTVGDILFASGSTTLSKLADVATGNALISGGVGVAPSYGKIGLTTHVSGTLPIANGGTNGTATPTAGTIAYGTGSAYAFNTAGTSGQPLLSGGAGAPTFGTLSVGAGGTGQTSYTDGQLLIGNTATTSLSKATLTAGSGVTITNGNGTITIAATGSGGTVTSVGATSPVASSGGNTPTISLNSAYGDTLNPYGSKTANFFLAAPNGSAGAPTFRAIVAADIPTLNQNTTGTASNVTGTVAVANGGTGATTAPNARTNLGATTVGSNFFTLTNPTAVTFPRINADNTVSALDAATFRSAIGAGTGSGTVTSVATAGTVNGITLTGGTITSTGTITLGGTLSGVSLTTQVTGTLPVANGGTGATSLTANNVILGNGTSAVQFVAPGTNGNVLTSNGTTWTSAAVSGGLSYIFRTTAVTLTDKQGVLTDTSAGAFTVTLPATPATGAQVVVADAGNAWGTNNLTVGRNGSTIQGLAEDLVCNITGASVQFVYDGTTWEIYSQIGAQGGTVVLANTTNTFTAAQTFRAANAVRSEAAATQDAVVLAGRAGGTGSFASTITPTTLTASRTVTLPDANTTVPVATQVLTFSGPTAARTITLPDQNFTVGFRNLPAVGTQTGSYTLGVNDVGKYVQVSTGGSITIPTSTFAEGDAITLFNNTTGNVTITCSAPTAYIAGTNTVKTSMTLATRGVATILFISATLCVVTGNVT